MKNKSLRFKILAIILFFICFFPNLGVNASTDDTPVKIIANFRTLGTPYASQTMFTQNIETAYEKIKDGNFTEQDLKSTGWTQVAQDYKHTDNIIEFSEHLKLGLNIRHSSQEAQDIISFLYQNNYKNLINTLNGSGGSRNQIKFHVPGNKGRNYTDVHGKAEADGFKGLNAIFNLQQQFITFVNAEDDQKEFNIDVVNKDKRISFSITNVSDQAQTQSSLYTIEYNQELSYRLHIDKSLLTQPTKVQLTPEANLVIDDISVPYTSLDTISTINPDGTNSALTVYYMDLPASASDITITVKSHLVPEVYNPNTESQIKAYTLPNAKYNIVASVSGLVAGYLVSNTSDAVTTSGINFAMTNPVKNILVRGGEYALGKIEKQQEYFYNTSGEWTPISDFSNIRSLDYKVISGGNNYVIGLKDTPIIPLNTNRYSFDAKKDTKINKSLIQFRGLSPENEYFLFQTKAPDGYKKIDSKQLFSVFNETKLLTNNSWGFKNSIGFANQQSFRANGKIPDYVAGTNEYNTLSVIKNHDLVFNSIVKIILPILIALLVIIAISIVVLKFI